MRFHQSLSYVWALVRVLDGDISQVWLVNVLFQMMGIQSALLCGLWLDCFQIRQILAFPFHMVLAAGTCLGPFWCGCGP